MKLRITKMDGHKAALISALYTMIVSLCGVVIFLFVLQSEELLGFFGIVLFFTPIAYFLIGYLFTRLGVFIFNIVSQKSNGFVIECKIEDDKIIQSVSPSQNASIE